MWIEMGGRSINFTHIKQYYGKSYITGNTEKYGIKFEYINGEYFELIFHTQNERNNKLDKLDQILKKNKL